MLIRLFATFICLCAIISCSDSPRTGGYDVACEIFTTAQVNNQPLDYEILIDKLVKTLGKDDQVVVAWEALVNLTPEQRYEEFQFFAREYHTPDWSCPAMEMLAPKL